MTTNILTILKKKRVEAHIHQETISNALGITQSSYSRIESGQSRLTLKDFLLICEILEIEPAQLIKEMEDTKK